METRHLKFNYTDAVSARKNILSAEINLLHIAKKIREYNLLRKNEIALKNKLIIVLASLKANLKTMQSSLPEEEKTAKQERERKKETIKENKDIQYQLKEIQDKLAKLS